MSNPLTIQGMKFEFEDRYAEGYVLNTGEARALNNLLRENLRNNFSSKLRTARENGLPDETIREMFASYARTYNFTAVSGELNNVTKLERMMRDMAKQVVEATAAKAGKSTKSFNDDQWDVAIAMVLRNRPDIRAEAERQLDQMAKLADVLLDEEDAA